MEALASVLNKVKLSNLLYPKVQEVRPDPAATLDTQTPRVVIDHTAFPHIIENIMWSSIHGLIAFRSTSRAYRDLVTKEFSRLTLIAADESDSDSTPHVRSAPMVELRSRSGRVLDTMIHRTLWSIAPKSPLMEFLNHLAVSDIRPVIKVVGRCKNSQVLLGEALWHICVCRRTQTSPAIDVAEVQVAPGPHGEISQLFPDLSTDTAITMVDNWATYELDSCTSPPLFFDPLYRDPDGPQPGERHRITYQIFGITYYLHFISTPAPPRAKVYYNFDEWPWGPDEFDRLSGRAGTMKFFPYFFTLSKHVVKALLAGCEVCFEALERVEPDSRWDHVVYSDGKARLEDSGDIIVSFSPPAPFPMRLIWEIEKYLDAWARLDVSISDDRLEQMKKAISTTRGRPDPRIPRSDVERIIRVIHWRRDLKRP